MNYEQLTMNYANKNKANQSQYKPNTNPIKTNSQDAQMNVSSCFTMNYEQLTMNYANKNKANQTQYKPNSLDAQMNATSFVTNHYENKPLRPRRGYKPNQTQFFQSPKNYSRKISYSNLVHISDIY